MHISTRQIIRGLRVLALTLAITAIAASPAGAFTRILKVTSALFWTADTGANNVAVDRDQGMFAVAEKSYHTFNSDLASKVFELSPGGKRISQILGKVPRGSHTLTRGEVAVTPDGHRVFLAGGDSDSGDGGSFIPFVGEWSASTRRFIHGTNFDTVAGDLVTGAAVDSTGHHLFVADHIKRHSNRIFEFRIPDLHRERVFTLHGDGASLSGTVDGFAVGGPDGDLYVEVDRSERSFIQVYTPSGGFVRELASGGDHFGVAVNAVGQVYSGSNHGLRMWDDKGHSHGTRIHTSDPVIAEAFDPSDDLFAYQVSSHCCGGSILKFRPRTAITSIGGYSGKVSTATTVAFGLDSTDPKGTFECRLIRAGFDRPPFTPCPQIPDFFNVPNGSYTFEARAVSVDGWVDSPKSYSFKQAVAYAHARITSHPATLIGGPTATFAFTSNTVGATFQCQLVPFGDAQGPFKPCSSPIPEPGLTHGLYNFEVEAITPDGYAEPLPAEYQFAVDPVPPTVSAPAASLASGQQLGITGDTAIGLNWSASDPNTASANLVESIQEHSGPSAGALGAYATVPGAGGTGQPQAAVTVAPGSTLYQFRAQAQNSLGVVGTGPDGALLQLGLVDSADPAVTYSTAWSAPVQDAAAIDGTVKASTASGASASLVFTGTSIGVVGVLGAANGPMTVCIDPSTEVLPCSTVSEASSTTTQRELIFATGLTDAQHTIQISAPTATPILLDGFVVLR